MAAGSGAAFSTILLPGPDHHWPAPRRPYYLREGSPRDLLDYIDGVLLIDIWEELDLPDPIRG